VSEAIADCRSQIANCSEALIQQCWKIALREGHASVSLFRRALRLEDERAASVIETLEARRLIAQSNNGVRQPRRLLISDATRRNLGYRDDE
jgi:DNA segregation ATPase FtsK/SpoIIIE-like protein